MKHIYLILFFITLSVNSQNIDPTFNQNHAGPYVEKIGTKGAIRSDGKILSYRTETNTFLLINNDGSIDTTFNSPVINGLNVQRIIVRSDGTFGCINVNSNMFLIFNPDGTLNTNFIPPTFTIINNDNGLINFLFDEDGKIVVWGNFITINGVSAIKVARLNSNGSLDTSFSAGTSAYSTSLISSVAKQADGKYIVGGTFDRFNGDTNRRILVRLNNDGSIDTSFYQFNINGSNYRIGNLFFNSIKIESDGKIMVCGPDVTQNGIYKSRSFFRLLPNGSLDLTFACFIDIGNIGRQLVLLDGGKYLIKTDNKFKRLNNNGSEDLSFNGSSYLNFTGLYDFQVFPDGKLLINRDLDNTTTLSKRRYGMYRLTSDGILDLTFNPQQSTNISVSYMKILKNNKILSEGGAFYNDLPNLNSNMGVNILTEDGELDNEFVLDENIRGFLYCKEQNDNKLIVLNAILIENGNYVVKKLLRVLENGSLDLSFNYTDANTVIDFEILNDGKILSLYTSAVNGYRYYKRFNNDGTLDTTFNSVYLGDVSSSVNKFKKFNDGQIFLYKSDSLNNLRLLNADGTINTTFTANYNSTVMNQSSNVDIFRQSSDKYLVSYRSGNSLKISRINLNGQIDASFNTITRSNLSSYEVNLFVNSDEKIIAFFKASILTYATIMETYSFNGALENSIIIPYNIKAVVQQSCDRLLVSRTTNNLIYDLQRYLINTSPFVLTPVGSSLQTFYAGNTLSNLNVSGQNILWYSTQSQCGQNILQRISQNNDIPLPASTLLVDGTTYFASQTINGIESKTRLPVKVSLSLGINDNTTFSVLLAPNPVKNTFSLQSNDLLQSVELYNVLGQKVFEQNYNDTSLTIDISTLTKGNYILKVYSDTGQKTLRLLKE